MSETDTLVTAGNARHLVVHTGKAGKFNLRLPAGKTAATELFTRRKFRAANGVLTLKAPGAMTWFLELE